MATKNNHSDMFLLNRHYLLTPHQLEYEGLINRCQSTQQKAQLQQTTILKKSIVDQIYGGGKMLAEIKGGNAGLTKGGSGDVLANTGRQIGRASCRERV